MEQTAERGSSARAMSVPPALAGGSRAVYLFHFDAKCVPHIWRINRDGSNPKQITSGDFADVDPTCAPDGQWITFVSLRTGTPRLWKVGVDGGEAVQLTDKPSGRALFSPDGTSLACGYFVEGAASPWKIAIIPIAGGEPSKLIDAPQREGWAHGRGPLTVARLFTLPVRMAFRTRFADSEDAKLQA